MNFIHVYINVIEECLFHRNQTASKTEFVTNKKTNVSEIVLILS